LQKPSQTWFTSGNQPIAVGSFADCIPRETHLSKRYHTRAFSTNQSDHSFGLILSDLAFGVHTKSTQYERRKSVKQGKNLVRAGFIHGSRHYTCDTSLLGTSNYAWKVSITW
jgi:hypothetical protein